MSEESSLPAEKQICDLFTDLLGRAVRLQPASPFLLDSGDPFSVAVYVDNRLATTALAVLDLPLSAHLGAALGLLPPLAAEDAIGENGLSEVLVDNLYEVVNVVSSLFNKPHAPHVKLYALYAPGSSAPRDVLGWVEQPFGRLDVEVTLPGYGSGHLTVIHV